MLPPGTLVKAIRSALAFVILPEYFASFLSLVTHDEMPNADKATIRVIERRKSLGFMIQVGLSREYGSGANGKVGSSRAELPSKLNCKNHEKLYPSSPSPI